MNQTFIKFYRGAATQVAQAPVGAIWFDTEDDVIKVRIATGTENDWEVYGTSPAELSALAARVQTLEEVTIPELETALKSLITNEENRAKGEEERIEGLVTAEVDRATDAEEALGKRIDDLAAAAVSVKEGTINHVKVTKSGTEYTVEGDDIASAADLAKEIENARAAEKGLADRLDIIEGEDTVEGSIKKAVADAKAAIEGTLADDDAKTLEAINDELDTLGARGYKVAEVTEGLPANIERRYQLVDQTGTVIEGSVNIDVEKESALKNVELVDADADGVAGNYLKWTYVLANGTEKVQYLNVSDLLVEAEFKDGLAVSAAGEVSVKVDAASEAFLTVGADGVKLSGVQDAIDAAKGDAIAAIAPAIAELDATVGSKTVAEGKHIAVEVVETDGKLTGLTIVESDIASDARLAEIELVTSASLNEHHAQLVDHENRITTLEGAVEDLEGAIADKNVDAEGDSLVSATAANNKVTVAATQDLKDAVDAANKAVQTVSSENGTIAASRTENAVNLELVWQLF